MDKSWLKSRIALFLRHDQGNVILMFGLAFIPLMIAVGAAIDYGVASRDASALGTATDAAVLAVVAPASPAFQQAIATNVNGAISVPSGPYVSMVQANIGSYPEMTLTKTNVSIARSGLNITGTITATASINTYIMGMFGYKNLTISKSSTATVNLPPFTDFHLMLDNSPSMGIAATPTDISNLQQDTAHDTTYLNNVAGQAGYCAFACHDLSQNGVTYNYGGTKYPTDTYTTARNNNVTLRIDLLRSATQNLMGFATSVENNDNVANLFRFAIYTFGATSTAAWNSAVTNVVPISSNLGNVATQASAVDLMTVDKAGEYNDQDTPFDAALTSFSNSLPPAGDGSSSNSRQEVLFIVTDGVADESLNGSRTIEPINLNLCSTIKKSNIQIAVLYTVYYPITNNSFYNTYVAPYNPVPNTNNISPTVEGNLQQCASPGFYGRVDVGGNVTQAMQNLFSKIISTSHLTH